MVLSIQYEQIIPTSENLNRVIKTYEIEQYFLRYSIVESDVGSYVIVNIALNNLPFYIGYIVQNLEKSVMIHPIVQRDQIDINRK